MDGPDGAGAPGPGGPDGPGGHGGQDDPGEAAGPAGVRPVDLRDYVTFSPDEATRVRVLTSPHLALDVWCMEPQQATPVLHEPGRDLTYTVLAGRSWFVTDDGEIGLDPMAAMLVPADTVHGIANRAADPLIVVVTSAPPSQEPEGEPAEQVAAAVHRDPEAPGRIRRALTRLLGGDRSG